MEIIDHRKLAYYLATVLPEEQVVLDTETTGLEWWDKKLIGLGVNIPKNDQQFYCIAEHDYERSEIKKAVRILPKDVTVVGHNLKFDLHFLGIDLYETGWTPIDTTVMIHLLDSRYHKSLADAERIFLGNTSKKNFVESAPKGKRGKNLPIWEWPSSIRAPYCVNDTIVTWDLCKVLSNMLDEYNLWPLMLQEMEFLCLLLEIENTGFHLDVPFVEQCIKLLRADLTTMETQLYDSVGYKFNRRSNPQLSKALYEDLGVARPINPFADADGVDRSRFAFRGKYNKSATSTFILSEKVNHPLADLIGNIREADKLIDSAETWLELKDSEDDIHTDFNQTGTRTGRLASKHPNLQNVASDVRGRFFQQILTNVEYSAEAMERSGEFNLRKAFVAREDHSLVSIDYKQMEMRMFGILSGDPFMLKSLDAGSDIHADMAEAVWHNRDHIHREWAKMISFGLIYGMSTGSLQFRLGMTLQAAKKVTEQYWSTFPRTKPWMQGVIADCEKNGCVANWAGRLWWEEDKMEMFKGANAIIQGGCFDLLKTAALRSQDYLQEHDCGHILSLVHDEIIFEIPNGCLNEHYPALQKIMEVPDLLKHPFLTDVKIGNSYGSMEKVHAERTV